MGMLSRIQTAVRMRPADLLRYTAHRAVESFCEWRFGVDTGHEVFLDTLGITDKDAVRYSPIPYPAFFKAMRSVNADLSSSIFVDYGSGLGRAVICAATLPFQRVIGVELSEELAARARRHLDTARARFACKDVSIITTNATLWRLPTESNVFHFYNPFLNETLRSVVGEIARSLRENPREAWIVFGAPWQMSRLMSSGEIIPKAWQKAESCLLFPFHKDLSPRDPNGNRYRIYRISSLS